ncbi:O-acetylhomoserine aminocarboxypropyltransferase/cysteine synthase family protein [Actinomyces provencensis]|uniref:O-acetylhomoserine aminocarboxypropyltransferase/cysteine synthase family protein n=1 Tax=Actinomyces provencensis TaxID=1720198 RepID=UPI00096A7EC8|nr:aminotransferase class I/II-fold pyridoxal phosphate-dependent enzyme [Actinomyces provencensis]
MSNDLGFGTRSIHAGYTPADHNWSVVPPIYQTAAFDLGDTDRARRLWTGEEAAGIYTRVGNPTVGVLEERIAALEGGSAAIGLASGMSAISYVALLLGEGGGTIISGSSLYGAAQEALKDFLPRFGVNTRFVADRNDPAAYEALIDDDTRAVFIESISNPNAELYDIDAIAEVAHRHGVPVVVDNTVATPYLLRPFEHGADIVVYSATKGLSGHGNVIAGLVVENGTFQFGPERFANLHEKSWKIRDIHDRPRTVLEAAPTAPITTALRAFHLEFIGAKLAPSEAYLALLGLATIKERLDVQVRNAQALAEHLQGHDHVEWVRYPGLASSEFHDLALRDFPHGAGGILSFGFGGDHDQLRTFISALEVFSYHVNIGDVRSLIVNSPRTTHAELAPEVHELAGIPPNLVRISAGLEDTQDLVDDLDRAFAATFGH